MDQEQNAMFDDNNSLKNNHETMSVSQWLITLIVLAIPCVNIIMYLIWAFGNGNQNRKNFCIAGLIMMAASALLGFLFFILIGFFGVSSSMMSTMPIYGI